MTYGCNTTHPDWKPRAEGRHIQDGWEEIEVMEKVLLPCLNNPGYAGTAARPRPTRVPKMKWCPNRMSQDCDYDRCQTDPGCKGCRRAQVEIR